VTICDKYHVSNLWKLKEKEKEKEKNIKY